MDNTFQMFEELMGMTWPMYIISEIPTMLINLAIYVFTALALYAIAKRRGIHNPWLAWIPFANTWLLGCISDQYRALAKGETKYRRRWLLITEILTSVLSGFVLLLCFSMLGQIFAFTAEFFGFGLADFMNPENLEMIESMENQVSDADAQRLLAGIMGPTVGMVLLALMLAPVAIVHMVLSFIALHDIYKSCDPSNATLFLVLSIFIPYTQPLFLFLYRNKDGGMPMWQPPQPVYQPYQPVYGQTTYQQPTTPPSPPVPPTEPWEREGE